MAIALITLDLTDNLENKSNIHSDDNITKGESYPYHIPIPIPLYVNNIMPTIVKTVDKTYTMNNVVFLNLSILSKYNLKYLANKYKPINEMVL